MIDIIQLIKWSRTCYQLSQEFCVKLWYGSSWEFWTWACTYDSVKKKSLFGTKQPPTKLRHGNKMTRNMWPYNSSTSALVQGSLRKTGGKDKKSKTAVNEQVLLKQWRPVTCVHCSTYLFQGFWRHSEVFAYYGKNSYLKLLWSLHIWFSKSDG